MKKYLVYLLLITSQVFSATAVVGGYISPKSNSSCIQEDFETLICTISSNTPTYEFQLFVNTPPDVSIEKIEITGISGTLGEGLAPIINKPMERVSNEEFAWIVDEQKSSTIDYSFKVKITYNPFSGNGNINFSYSIKQYF